VKGIVSGVEQAIGKMKLKESARVFVQPKYGYGSKGNEDLGIPGGATLTYEIRLNNFTKVRSAAWVAIATKILAFVFFFFFF